MRIGFRSKKTLTKAHRIWHKNSMLIEIPNVVVIDESFASKPEIVLPKAVVLPKRKIASLSSKKRRPRQISRIDPALVWRIKTTGRM